MEIRMIYKKGHVDMIIVKDALEDRFTDTDEVVVACIDKLVEYAGIGEVEDHGVKIPCVLFEEDEEDGE